MTDSKPTPGVLVTLAEIYQQVQDTDSKVDKLAAAVGDMVAINRRLDQHHDRLNDHGQRLGSVETQQAVQNANRKPKAPWYSVVGAVVAIVTGTVAIFSLLSILNQISAALGG